MSAHYAFALSATRRRALERLYGLSEDDFTALLQIQSGRCGICQRPFTPARVPNVDHQHDGEQLTRGLLDTRCNHDLLGHFGDRVEIFQNTVAYLLSPPATLLDGPPRRAPGAPLS